jgi:gamma-glutamyltranspeptidase/glutathione hydrolase
MTIMTTTSPAARTAHSASGVRGAAATGHRLATDAALEMLADGGSAVDAAVAAHAVLTVVLPGSCGVGGDALLLIREPSGGVTAVNGTGTSAAAAPPVWAADGGASVTVPGAVDAWHQVLTRFGSRGLADVLAPAIRAAADGFAISATLCARLERQRPRLERGGAAGWSLLDAAPGDVVVQPALAGVLEHIAADGPDAYYRSDLAAAISRAVVADGGSLAPEDLAAHTTIVTEPVAVGWGDATVYVQPPVSQGVLLAMALQWLDRHAADVRAADLDHVCAELTEAVFAFRDRCARDGAALLEEPLEVDLERAARRGGPKPYLHTTGVATADADGWVVSSLLTVFDDFGAGTFVPEGGFVLTNRGAGFSAAPNHPAPGRRPVHTLAPALVDAPDAVTAIATPGADGQVQTLLQVLSRQRFAGLSLPDAVGAPRWRSSGSSLHVEASLPAAEALRDRGHEVVPTPDGDPLFGAVVSATCTPGRGASTVGDWRRDVAAGAI